MPILETQDLTYVYGAGTPFEKTAVDHISLQIEEGELVGVIGHTGSGKSTFVQQLNGLLKPTSGKVLLKGKDIWAEPKKIRAIRFQVGMVFQYPEHQLFEETVEKDIAFGPKNMGLSEEEIKRQEFLKKERIRSRERNQKLKSGERTVGVPITLTCKCCGQEFASKRTNTLFCGPNCRAKFYRQEAAEGRSRACTCENCGKVFTTTRSDVKYCSDDCRYAAQIKRQGARKKALREAKIEPAVPEKKTKTA